MLAETVRDPITIESITNKIVRSFDLLSPNIQPPFFFFLRVLNGKTSVA